MRAMFVIVAAAVLTACAPSKHAAYMDAARKQAQDCASSAPPVVRKLTPDANVRMELRSACVPVERGVIEGFAYFVDHSIRRAEFAVSPADIPWVVKCSADSMTDQRYAQITKGNLSVTRTAKGDHVSVIGKRFPGSIAQVRIDDSPAVGFAEAAASEGAAFEIVSGLMAGGSAMTRYIEWPSKTYRDAHYSAAGFPQAYRYAESCIR